MSEPREADITISGVVLSEAQSMTVRVAVSSMQMQLGDPEFSAALGKVADAYRARLGEVLALIMRTAR